MTVATLVAPAMARLTQVLVSLPPGDSDPASGKGPEWGKAAPIGLLIWLLMGLALFFLIKSMNRNLRKVPASFEDAPTPSDQDSAAEPPDSGDGADHDSGDDHAGGAAGDAASVGPPASPVSGERDS